MSQQVSSEDLHISLQAFYQALAKSVEHPVLVSDNGIPVYYHMFDDQESEIRVKQVRHRVKTHSAVILEFMHQHMQMSMRLNNIEEAANVDAKQRVIKNTFALLSTYRSNIRLINDFKKNKTGEGVFLDFPSTLFYGKSGNHRVEIDFNFQKDRDCAFKQADNLEKILLRLQKSDDRIKFGVINTPCSVDLSVEQGGTLLDDSYTGKIDFVKNLLDQVGFRI